MGRRKIIRRLSRFHFTKLSFLFCYKYEPIRSNPCCFSRSIRPEVPCKKGVLKNFLRPETLLNKRLQHSSFPVNFAKILVNLYLQKTSGSFYISLLHLTEHVKDITKSLFLKSEWSFVWIFYAFFILYKNYFIRTIKITFHLETHCLKPLFERLSSLFLTAILQIKSSCLLKVHPNKLWLLLSQ